MPKPSLFAQELEDILSARYDWDSPFCDIMSDIVVDVERALNHALHTYRVISNRSGAIPKPLARKAFLNKLKEDM